MKQIYQKIIHFYRNTTAATAIEYGLIAALIAVVCIGSIQLLRAEMITMWNFIGTSVSKANSG